MNRNTYGTRLIGNSTGDSLANPPCSIRRKLEAFRIVKLFNSANKTQIAFLNKIKKEHATSNIAFCNGYYQAQVRFNKHLLSIKPHHFNTRKLAALKTCKLFASCFQLFKLATSLNSVFNFLCKHHFFISIKQ